MTGRVAGPQKKNVRMHMFLYMLVYRLLYVKGLFYTIPSLCLRRTSILEFV